MAQWTFLDSQSKSPYCVKDFLLVHVQQATKIYEEYRGRKEIVREVSSLPYIPW